MSNYRVDDKSTIRYSSNMASPEITPEMWENIDFADPASRDELIQDAMSPSVQEVYHAPLDLPTDLGTDQVVFSDRAQRFLESVNRTVSRRGFLRMVVENTVREDLGLE